MNFANLFTRVDGTFFPRLTHSLAVRFSTLASLLCFCSLVDVLDSVADFADLFSLVVGDLHTELLFERHDQLDRVEGVSAEIVQKRGGRRNLLFVDVELIDDDLFDALFDSFLVGHFAKIVSGRSSAESSHRHATVNVKNLSSDVARLVRAEVSDERGDVSRFAETFERHDLKNFGGRLGVVDEPGRHVGPDESGGNGVDCHAPAREFASDGLGEPNHAGFGGGIVGLAGVAHHAAHGSDVDDAPPAGARHRPADELGPVKAAREIGRDHVVPIGIAHAKQEPIARDARVVHEDVDRGKLLEQLLRGLGDRGAIGDVDGEGLRLAARRNDRGRGGTARIGRFRDADDGDAVAQKLRAVEVKAK